MSSDKYYGAFKKIGKHPKYKNVYVLQSRKSGKTYYMPYMTINYTKLPSRFYEDEKEAAIAVDKFLIKHHKDPVNILKKT